MAADTDLQPKIKRRMGPTAPSRGWEKALRALARRLRKGLGSILPGPAKHFARQVLSVIRAGKARARLTVGVQPISSRAGWDRGTTINRYYLEQFLQEYSSDIFGRCLEFQSDTYTSFFGGDKVTKLDILHKDIGNGQATLVADLTKANNIQSNWFDCIICTYVLHGIFEIDKAISELHRILKPGGVLLIAVPGFNRTCAGYNPLWFFTPEGLRLLLARVFAAENVSVHAYGNSLTAAGHLRGLAAHEFTKGELNYHTREFAVGVFARARKQGYTGRTSYVPHQTKPCR